MFLISNNKKNGAIKINNVEKINVVNNTIVLHTTLHTILHTILHTTLHKENGIEWSYDNENDRDNDYNNLINQITNYNKTWFGQSITNVVNSCE